MTTIGQLPRAASVSDTDELAIYQNGQTLSATRSQVLAGVQSALTLPPNTLLGGVGPGTSAPVPINIGTNLTLSGSTLSAAAAPFNISALNAGNTPVAGNLIPIAQGGNNASVSYSDFMSGLQNISGVSGNNLTAVAYGGSATRSISELAANAISIEDFGAVGDGVTDDSAALQKAIANGQPVRLGAKTYAIAGECDIGGATCSLIGVVGLSVLKRSAQSNQGTSSAPAWISVSCTSFFADGIIFDANNGITQKTYAVVIQSSCIKSLITKCTFQNSTNGSYGNGLTYLPSDPTVTNHHVEDCEFCFNSMSGLYVLSTDGIGIVNCRAHDNNINGIVVDSRDPSFVLKSRFIQIVGNSCWNNNQVGILVGNFVANNIFVQPFQYGNQNPDILSAVVSANNCYSNGIYGIYVSGRNILVSSNLCSNNSTKVSFGAGILADTGYCKITGNMISGATAFGIDCGGSICNIVDNNYINGAITGLNVGGSQYCTIRENFIQDCTISIDVENVEGNGNGDNFRQSCVGLSINSNWISYNGSSPVIAIRDAAQNISVKDNIIIAEPGASLTNVLLAYTDSIIIKGNLLNFTEVWPVNPTMINGVYTLAIPDIADCVSISQCSGQIASIMTTQAIQNEGAVVFIKVINGGSNYTAATANVNGQGSGASAEVLVSGGQVIGVRIQTSGSGYDINTTVSISGDGFGAEAIAQVGLPCWQNRQVKVECLTPVAFAVEGASPAQVNWTGAPITIPSGANVDWIGMGNNGWRTTSFTQNDYISPNGDGSLTIKNQSGDISILPSSGGSLRLLSDTEQVGAVELIGRGSPQSVVPAPAGSTFRNLNGGIGATFWVKQSGNDANNWVAVA